MLGFCVAYVTLPLLHAPQMNEMHTAGCVRWLFANDPQALWGLTCLDHGGCCFVIVRPQLCQDSVQPLQYISTSGLSITASSNNMVRSHRCQHTMCQEEYYQT